MVAMTISRRLVSLAMKFCIFMYYVKHVENKQWVAKDATNIEWKERVGRCMMVQEEGLKGKWK